MEPLVGWLALHEAMIGDAVAGEASARTALACARESGDADLQLCALSELGAKLVDQGRVAEGMGYLDEAMAGSLGGEPANPETVVYTCCVTIKSCASCAQFERAVQWLRAADRFTRRYGNPFLYASCRGLLGAVLVATGDWAQAEEELCSALERSRGCLPAVHAPALAALAELRLAQGRLEEAERLVAGLDEHPAAVPVIARIHLAAGRPASAGAVARRWLAELDNNELRRVPLVELLGEADLAEGRPETAGGRARALVDLGARLGCEVAVARGQRLRSRALAASTDHEAARGHLDTALASFSRLGMPLETARTRMLLAHVLRKRSPEAAGTEARAALSVFDDLGARRDADAAAALLRDLGVTPSRAGRRSAQPLTAREREVLTLLAEGLSNPQIAERLYISRRTVEDLVANVLAKLGLRNRAEAAAEAARQLGTDPPG